jgi:transcription-repair coupling factor (superfamily II helicase)
MTGPISFGPAEAARLLSIREIDDAVARLDRRADALHLTGLFGAAKAAVLCEIARRLGRPLVVVTVSAHEAEALSGDLRFFSGAPVGYLPERGAGAAARWQRITCLAGLARKELSFAVVSIEVAVEPLASPSILLGAAVTLRVRQCLPRDRLVEGLETGGYRRVGQVTERGEYSVRGNLLDVFPPTGPSAVRAEFFGDELVSLREFDVATQRSVQALQELTVLPAVEGDPVRRFDRPAGLFDYAAGDAVCALVDPEGLKARVRGSADLPSGVQPATWADVEARLGPRSRICLDEFSRPDAPGEPRPVAFRTSTIPAYRGRLRELARDVGGWQVEGRSVNLVCRGEPQGRRLQAILGEYDVAASVSDRFASRGGIAVVAGELSAGFHLHEAGLTLITEAEVFGPRHAPGRRRARSEGTPFESHADLAYGDYVVHVDHGIGRYKGLRQLAVGGAEGDYLLVTYADNARLYVPAGKLHLVHRYLGTDGDPPALDRLGGTSWARAKERVRASIREMAQELLSLYAARQVIKGHAFPHDTPWQREFEAGFPYEETPGQFQAIADVKADMEQDRPMDRLICGDVGYGKTEVALRAAFKAVMDGKQVAVLVPTTVLALQHFQTFAERFGTFPITVEMLSRFRSRGEQAEVLRGLRGGEVDIVVGTHRLLQRDVHFRDLGLLVVDEEHRFGVAAKERLKQVRRQVDVLTLSATPIPRTLHMALLGVRDVSTIETPPEDRLSIQTVVARFDPTLIRDAIEEELNRGGQVFFVHNRVENIHAMARLIKRLVPRARLAVAHGELREDRLERIMCDFYSGRSDVLLCTTIIESGLDVATANTIIIDRADTLGLAQLYQLRGRVGREKRRAYAYFLIPEETALSDVAKKRLQVIAELTELGSGFKVAARDLEIRGAGNLLGTEQHGQIAAVGFDLYCRLIESTIRELKGEPAADTAEPAVRLDAEGYLPEAYVEDPNTRLQFYRRLAALSSTGDVASIREELVDRFGELPPQADRLLHAVILRIMARELAIRELDARKDRIRVVFGDATPLAGEKVAVLLRAAAGRLRYVPKNVLEYEANGADRVSTARALLGQLLECR